MEQSKPEKKSSDWLGSSKISTKDKDILQVAPFGGQTELKNESSTHENLMSSRQASQGHRLNSAQVGDRVSIEYTGRFPAGEIFESSKGQSLSFIAGSDELLAGVSNAVVGMNSGESKSITLQPEAAYGERKAELIEQVPRSNLPELLTAGQRLHGNFAGEEFAVTIREVCEEYAIVDANHPLAGETLVFDIELLKIDRAAIPKVECHDDPGQQEGDS